MDLTTFIDQLLSILKILVLIVSLIMAFVLGMQNKPYIKKKHLYISVIAIIVIWICSLIWNLIEGDFTVALSEFVVIVFWSFWAIRTKKDVK